MLCTSSNMSSASSMSPVALAATMLVLSAPTITVAFDWSVLGIVCREREWSGRK